MKSPMFLSETNSQKGKTTYNDNEISLGNDVDSDKEEDFEVLEIN